MPNPHFYSNILPDGMSDDTLQDIVISISLGTPGDDSPHISIHLVSKEPRIAIAAEDLVFLLVQGLERNGIKIYKIEHPKKDKENPN